MLEAFQELERTSPPHNLSAEMAVLRILFHNNNLIEETRQMLPWEEFYKDNHQIIYQTMLRLSEEKIPVDLITLADRLEQKDNLESVGGADNLKKLFLERSPEMETNGYSPANLESYIEIIHEKCLLRRLIVSAGAVLAATFEAKRLGDRTLQRNLHKLISAAKTAIGFEKSKGKK